MVYRVWFNASSAAWLNLSLAAAESRWARLAIIAASPPHWLIVYVSAIARVSSYVECRFGAGTGQVSAPASVNAVGAQGPAGLVVRVSVVSVRVAPRLNTTVASG